MFYLIPLCIIIMLSLTSIVEWNMKHRFHNVYQYTFSNNCIILYDFEMFLSYWEMC